MKLLIAELAQIEGDFQLEDFLDLLKNLLRSIRNLTWSLDQLRNLIDFVRTVEPLLKSSVPQAIHHLDQLEQKGVFRLFTSILRAMQKIGETYSPEDLDQIANGLVPLVGIAKKLTAPEPLELMSRSSDLYRNADAWLEQLGLSPQAGKYPGQLSGGQRQRTAIARTLALEPDLLLMDEPFSSLDAPTREDLQNLTLELWSEQKLTLIVVTHAIEEAAVLGQKILLLAAPPNTSPLVIDNPGACRPGCRETTTYLDICRELRRNMESASAGQSIHRRTDAERESAR